MGNDITISSLPSLDPDAEGVSATPVPVRRRGGNFGNVVARLTGVNALGLVAGLVTAPITARALGADGRGELAAITAVLTMGPWIFDLGVSQWLARERALSYPRSELLGAALPVALLCSLIGVIAAIPLSHALGEGRPIVTNFLQIGLFLMPVSVLLQTLMGLAIGESRWGLYSVSRILSSIVPAIGIVALAVAGHLSVATAAAAYLVGGVLASLMFLRTIRGVRRLSFDLHRSWTAAVFGAKSWLSSVAGVANLRFDQVLMAGLVASGELGLYAVAVTLASIPSTLAGAVGGALFPRVAEGDGHLAARSCRITICVVALSAGLLAALSPAMIPFLFGSEFDAATTMATISLAASVPLAAAAVLGSVLSAANDPAAAMRAELVAIAFTVPALIVVLPSSGGRGAALVSLAAYSIRAAMQLRSAGRTLQMPWWRFVVPAAADFNWLMLQAREMRPRRGREPASSRRR